VLRYSLDSKLIFNIKQEGFDIINVFFWYHEIC
jgi:hypothetical protein